MKDQYAVFGNPIAQSKSPVIHHMFAAQTKQILEYRAYLVEIDGFNEAAQDFLAAGGLGLNITVPFKVDAFKFSQQVSPAATLAGAVNTLSFRNDTIVGDNTDGVGMVRDIVEGCGWELKGKRVLMLGAGGAAAGVLHPLLQERPATLVIANRTLAKAQHLLEKASSSNSVSELCATTLEELNTPFDVIINASSAGLAGEPPQISEAVIQPATFCYDMVYGPQQTPFLKWAQKHGASELSDGLGMLVEQAAESFYIWRGVRPKTSAVLQTLRSQL